MEQGTSEKKKKIKPELHPSGWWSAVSCPVPPQTSSGLLFQVKIKQDDTETAQDWHFPALCHVTLFEWISTFKNIQRKANEGCIKQKRHVRNKTLTRRKRATHVDTTKGKNIFKDTVTYPSHSFCCQINIKNVYYSTSIFPLWLYSGCVHRSISRVADEAQCSHQLLSQSSSRSRVHCTRAQLYWKEPWNYWKSCSEVWKIICRIFLLSYQEIWSSQQSTSLFSALKSTYRILFLTLLHRKNSLLSSIYFHFYLKGRK